MTDERNYRMWPVAALLFRQGALATGTAVHLRAPVVPRLLCFQNPESFGLFRWVIPTCVCYNLYRRRCAVTLENFLHLERQRQTACDGFSASPI